MHFEYISSWQEVQHNSCCIHPNFSDFNLGLLYDYRFHFSKKEANRQAAASVTGPGCTDYGSALDSVASAAQSAALASLINSVAENSGGTVSRITVGSIVGPQWEISIPFIS